MTLGNRVLLAAAFLLALLLSIGCAPRYGASHSAHTDDASRPWVAPGQKAEGVWIDSWDLVKGTSQAYGYKAGSRRWLMQSVADAVLTYREHHQIDGSWDAFVVSLGPTCGLLVPAGDGHYVDVWTGPIHGDAFWFCTEPARGSRETGPPVKAIEGAPFVPPGRRYALVREDGRVIAVDRPE